MEPNVSADAAVFETTVFLQYFNDLEDPRQFKKVWYPLDEVLILSLLAVLAGAEGFTDIADFGKVKRPLLRRFRPFKNGTPSHDQLGTIFAALDPQAFRRCFIAWFQSVTKSSSEVIAVDGKTSRRSGRKGENDALHTLSAFAAHQRLVLGQMRVDQKSNEITAIPALLELLSIEGAIVTIDAMGCQRAIAEKIVEKKADYVLALKGNQGTLRDDVELFANEQKQNGFSDTVVTVHEDVDAGHGRIETRRTTVLHDIQWLQERHQWPGLKAVVMVQSIREIGPKSEQETRFFITSLTSDAAAIAGCVRDHWAVENSLHWVMDVVFKDDDCRVRRRNAPENFVALKHAATNLIRQSSGKQSIRRKRNIASWDDEFLASLIRQ